MNQKTPIFHYSKHYGNLTHVTWFKVAVNMTDPPPADPQSFYRESYPLKFMYLLQIFPYAIMLHTNLHLPL